MPKRKQNSTKASDSSGNKRKHVANKSRKISESGSGACVAGTSSSDNHEIEGNKPDNPSARGNKRKHVANKSRKISESGSGACVAGTSSSDNHEIEGNKPDNPSARDESLKIERISPNKVFFSQDSISFKFSDGRKINDTVEDLKTGKVTVEDIPKITLIYLEEEQVYFSRDNRRLYVFQKYEAHCEKEIFIPVIVEKPSKGGKRSPFKTKELGKSIEIKKPKKGEKDDILIERWTPVKMSKSSK